MRLCHQCRHQTIDAHQLWLRVVDVIRQGNRMTWNNNDDGSSELADPDTVWRRYEKEGCSIRVLHPQRWCDPLW